MKDQNLENELTSIRNLMERSSKFISLSGLSGIMAGIYALIGAALSYQLVYSSSGIFKVRAYHASDLATDFSIMYKLMAIGIVVLVAAVGTGFYLTKKKADKNGQKIWGKTSRALMLNMAIPLLTGGIFMLIMILRGFYGIVAPTSLIFYGMALICASHYTFADVRYLGICEIILGLIAALWPGYGLIFWAIGFGVLHIIYGSLMYFKYDR